MHVGQMMDFYISKNFESISNCKNFNWEIFVNFVIIKFCKFHIGGSSFNSKYLTSWFLLHCYHNLELPQAPFQLNIFISTIQSLESDIYQLQKLKEIILISYDNWSCFCSTSLSYIFEPIPTLPLSHFSKSSE